MARTLRLIAALLAAATLLLPAAARAAGPAATAQRARPRRCARPAAARARSPSTSTAGGTIFAVAARRAAHAGLGREALHDLDRALTLSAPTAHLTTSALGDVGGRPRRRADGNLYLRGGGDPSFGARAARRARRPARARPGLREITGRVIGDESAFDARRGPPSEGFRTTSEVGPAERADLQPRPHRQAPPVLPGAARALFAARGLRARAAPPRRHRRRRARGPGDAAGGALPLAE